MSTERGSDDHTGQTLAVVIGLVLMIVATLVAVTTLAAMQVAAAANPGAAAGTLIGNLAGDHLLASTKALFSSLEDCDDTGSGSGGRPQQEPTSGGDVSQRVAAFDEEQQANARTIVEVGQQMHVPFLGLVIAEATAIQESSLRNVEHGDTAGPDSRGLFQQRAPWGPLAERMDPAGAARLFYGGGRGGQPGLMDIDGWQQGRLSLGQAAQAVQRSAYPQAYATHTGQALALVVSTLTAIDDQKAGPHENSRQIVDLQDMLTMACGPEDDSDTGARTPLPGDPADPADPVDRGLVNTAIAFARSQLGQPYLWGGDGPDQGESGFDCSGLTRAAYQSAGVPLPRTAQQQYDAGARVPLNRLQPGDLVFFGTDARTITHVGIFVGAHQMIDAPHTGAVVRSEDYRWDDLLGATRPTRTAP